MWGDADHRPWRRAGYHGRAPKCIASTPQALRYGQQASAVSFTQKALCNPSTSFFAWRAQHYPFRSSCPGWLRTAFICRCCCNRPAPAILPHLPGRMCWSQASRWPCLWWWKGAGWPFRGGGSPCAAWPWVLRWHCRCSCCCGSGIWQRAGCARVWSEGCAVVITDCAWANCGYCRLASGSLSGR